MNSKMGDSQSQTLVEMCDELFSLILYVRQTGDIDQPDALYKRITGLFTTIDEKGRVLKIPEVDINDVKYALVAVIDESMGWASRLELELYGLNIAGEEFFNRLEKIKTAKGRNEVLEVYYHCLALGFEGKFFRSPERLQEYINELQEILNLKKAGRLSPQGERPQETIRRRRGGMPAWLPWVITASSAVALVLIVFLLRFQITDWAADVVAQIRKLIQ
jgi:type VI secretion system protein ImpK